VATDEDANSDWDFAELTVHNEGDLYKPKIETVIVPSEGCSTSGTSRMGGLSIAGLALLAAALRRRQRR
jgi:MYXO-CTERM domain-containing protein